jgi:hypothetical protein
MAETIMLSPYSIEFKIVGCDISMIYQILISIFQRTSMGHFRFTVRICVCNANDVIIIDIGQQNENIISKSITVYKYEMAIQSDIINAIDKPPLSLTLFSPFNESPSIGNSNKENMDEKESVLTYVFRHSAAIS